MKDVSWRLVETHESELVFSFLTLAARMDETQEPIQKALVDKELTPYWREWGRDGDIGVVAIQSSNGLPVCCAWVRLFPKVAPGHGFVAEDIPELAIGAVALYRNRGIGAETLRKLIAVCQTKAAGISLSVRTSNPAVRLYERLGFKAIAGSERSNRVGTTSVTMLLTFTS